MTTKPRVATLIAGVPLIDRGVFHRVRYSAADPMIWIKMPDGQTAVILRDVELEGGRKKIVADSIHTYEDFAPAGGLSGDRAIRAAQAAGECLARAHIDRVVGGRSLALIYVDQLRRRGIEVVCDPDLGIADRRSKDDREVAALRQAQRSTEDAIEQACQMIARAGARADGALLGPEGDELTSERVRAHIDVVLAGHGCIAEAGTIVAGGPQGADCHSAGAGPLRTGQPVIVDVFPRDRATAYHGDCTRTVVHGDIPDEVVRMHAVVAKAKRASESATKAGATGEAVHLAGVAMIQQNAYTLGFPPDGMLAATEPTGFCSMPHGTGHGLGLDLKELPLLDMGGPELVVGDAVTIEPGLYAPGLGGIRIEDLYIVRADGYDNLNTLHEGLDWK